MRDGRILGEGMPNVRRNGPQLRRFARSLPLSGPIFTTPHRNFVIVP
jgi:hypothetical protein